MSLTDKAVSSTEDEDSLLSTYTQETINAKTEQLELEKREQFNIYYVKYARLIPKVVIYYLIFIGILIFMAGLTGTHIWNIEFTWHLSDKVLITLLATTTANVLGLMYIVANHLFPKIK